MYSVKNFLLLIIVAFCLVSCKPTSNEQSLIDAEWIIGTWKGTTKNNNVFYEQWERQGDSLFINTNYHFENGTKVIGGKSMIVVRDGTVFYVNGMDKEKEVSWRATQFSPTSMRFENGAITTYQTILFNLTDDNQWNAHLVTSKDTVSYSLKRVN